MLLVQARGRLLENLHVAKGRPQVQQWLLTENGTPKPHEEATLSLPPVCLCAHHLCSLEPYHYPGRSERRTIRIQNTEPVALRVKLSKSYRNYSLFSLCII